MYCQLRTPPVSWNQLSGSLGLSTQIPVCRSKPSMSKPQWDVAPRTAPLTIFGTSVSVTSILPWPGLFTKCQQSLHPLPSNHLCNLASLASISAPCWPKPSSSLPQGPATPSLLASLCASDPAPSSRFSREWPE